MGDIMLWKYRYALILVYLITQLTPAIGAAPTNTFSLEQVFGVPYPSSLISARKDDRIAWISYHRGRRNIYCAAAPDYKPVCLTSYTKDDGEEIKSLRISDDGGVIVYVRGGSANKKGWHANPQSLPKGTKEVIWSVRTDGSPPMQLAEDNNPTLSPDGKWVLYIRSNRVYRVPSNPEGKPMVKYLFTSRGGNFNLMWSPDSSMIAFVSGRSTHSYVGVYNCESRKINWMAPGVDFDSNPSWSADSTRIAFMRKPANEVNAPSAFRGGHMLEFWIADATRGKGRKLWQVPTSAPRYHSVKSLRWAGNDRILFNSERNNYQRVFSLSVGGGEPITLTPGEGLCEHTAISSDGRYLYYCTNRDDIDRRHIWKVPTTGGNPIPITSGESIETHPAALGSDKEVAVLHGTHKQPQSIALVPTGGGAIRIIAPELPSDFPIDDLVTPHQVIVKATDGWNIHCQIFVPRGAKAGDKRPGVVFVHGGPVRQMLLGWHYKHYYSNTYAFHQYLVNKGYLVLSVNFRRGKGYGRLFRTAPRTGRNGAAEYYDVLTAAKYLRQRPEIDSSRIGLWGGSYGGFLTALGLARNSDVFAAGVDLNGMHAYVTRERSSKIRYESSPIGYIDDWRSPVLLCHGDDDRNVMFANTVRLVQLLRPRNVHYELLIIPDEVHDFLIDENQMKFYRAADDFFDRFLMKPADTSQ
jgi:dipeptidyl-peptidase 4